LSLLISRPVTTTVDPEGRTPLAAVLEIRTREPTTATWTVLGEAPLSGGSPGPSTVHSLPIIGLSPGEVNWVELRIETLDGRWALDAFRFDTTPLPEFFPEIHIQVADPGRMEPGLTLSNFSVATGGAHLTYPFLFDSRGEIRWYLDMSEFGGLAYLVQSLENGNLLLSHGEAIMEWDLAGREVNRWPMPGFIFHHDIIEKPDGNFIVLVSRTGDPVVNDHIIEVSRATGAVVTEWDLRESLNPGRRDFPDSRDENWIHTNGIWYDASDDAIIVSGRNQTAVVKLTRDNEVVWILGAHQGWGPAGPLEDGPDLRERLLTAVDASGEPYPEAVQLGLEDAEDFGWPWAQHTPVLLPDGRIFVFDNGHPRHFEAVPEGARFSRGVEYEVDPQELTVRQTWEYGTERGPSYHSAIVSNVQHLPATGNRLVAPGITLDFGAWVTEVAYPGGEVVFEARMEFKNLLSSGEFRPGEFDVVYRARRWDPNL
jgi:arylsulfate sulfotransferase